MTEESRDKHATAVGIVRKLREAGFEALFAGGCVRDVLMKREPQDYDIATSAGPDDVERMFPKTVTVGKAFGVVKVIEGDLHFEVATFRSDGPYTDGRHPDSVTFGPSETDAARRDFTVNGMMYDPIVGRLFDDYNGQGDIDAKLIRCIGEPARRFAEDKLRMLRAIRFACQLGFEIEPQTFETISLMAAEIKVVSGERIRDELMKILLSPKPDRGVKLLHESGLLAHILPDVEHMAGCKQPLQFHPEGDAFEHTLRVLKHLRNPNRSWELALAALLHDIGKPPTLTETDRIRFNEHEKVGSEMAGKICDALRTSAREKETIEWLIRRHMVFKDVKQMRKAKLKRLFADPRYALLSELHRSDRLASDMDLDEYDFCERLFDEYSKEPLIPKPLIDGSDLKTMGLTPGPDFARLLTAAQDAQLEGRITTKDEALELVKGMLRS
jgi:poly(A) polymerase